MSSDYLAVLIIIDIKSGNLLAEFQQMIFHNWWVDLEI